MGGTAAEHASSAAAPSISGAAVRSLALLIIAGCLRFLLLGGATDAFMAWGPPLFLAGLGLAGLVWRRRMPAAEPAPGGEARRGGAPRALLVGTLCLLPAAMSLAYVAGIGAARGPGGVGWEGLVAGIVLYVAAAPVIEEFYFRQILHREFSVLFGRPSTAVAANAVWFAAIHPPQNIPVALAVGLCCATLRSLTGGLRLPILTHALANLALAIAGY